MNKKIFTLFVLLLLLPVTALAAEEIKLFIGGQQITESGCYANQNGTWTKVEGTGPSSGQFYYDAATFTLTLNQAEITHDQTVKVAEGYTYEGSVIAFSQTADVSLKIVVSQGTSTITGTGGIRVESTTGNASLSIKGSGSLDVEPKGSNSGITLCSSKNTNLDIDGADVTASSPAQYGVYLISSTDATSTSTITVNNGSLTTGGNGNVGIYYYWSGTSNAGTSSLTVSGNAVVDTRNSQIMAQNKETVVQVGAGSDGNGGIVFNGKNGTVYGDVTLQENLEIGEGESLTIPEDASLTVPDGTTLTNNGTINVESGGKLEGTTTGQGTLKIAPTITTQPQDVEVKENETATFTVKVTGTEPLSYQWQESNSSGNDWTNIDGANAAEYTTGQTTMSMNGTQYRCVVSNSAGSVESNAAALTVNELTTYTISTDVTPAGAGTVSGSGSYTEGASVTLTATANSGYRFVGWMEDGQQVSADATYTFTANSDHTLTARFEKLYTVTVSPVEGGTATADKATAAAGETITLTATPSSGYYFVEWKVVSGTVSIQNNKFTMPAGDVEVQAVFGLSVTNITLDKTELPLYTGDSEILTATIEPDNATNQAVTWESSDPNVATVDNGKVTAVAAGEAFITVTTADGGKTATCQVKVTQSTYSITADITTLDFGSVYIGYTRPTAQTVTITNTGNRPQTLDQPTSTTNFVVGTLSKMELAAGEGATFTVQPKAGLAVGTYSENITVSSSEGATVTIPTSFTVLGVTNIIINKSELILYIGDNETLTATIEPIEAAGQTVTWKSSNETIATVDANGKVTAVYVGEATITATVGDKTAICEVKVRKPAEVGSTSSTNLSFTTDRDEFALTAIVYGENLDRDKAKWTWSVANEDVVALSGLPTWRSHSYSINRQAFTIKGTGTTTITATYDDGTYRGSVDFTVRISKPTPPDPISYYNIYVEDVCDGVEVSTSKQVVREGGSITIYVEKDTARYTFDNFKVYYKRSYYGGWEELKEGTQPGEYPIKNIWTHIYIKAEGAEEKEDPTGIESIEGVKVYTKDGSLYVQTPQREQVIIVSMSGAVVKNEEQIGLKQYYGLQPGIYIVRVGDRAYKVRLN